VNSRLEVISGPEEGRSFELEEGRGLVVGRGKPCHFRIRDPRISRTHFLLEKGPTGYHVFDMGSLGGTFVNGNRVREVGVLPGDVIRAGRSEMRLVVAEPEEAPALISAEPPAAEPGAERGQTLTGLVGKTLAGFQIQALVAEGKLGVVFQALDHKKGLPVALKVLRPEFSSDADEMRRFVRAMKTVLALKHPNIVRVYSAGRSAGYCFVVMEYVDGESLARVIKRIGTVGTLEWSYALRVGVHMTRGLDAARHHQIVHRNVTPRNILIRRKDDLAKLGDLMLAKAIEGTLAERVTRTGMLVGDMAYMSPERTFSDAVVDERSDIYGLGATLYALLTGRPPLEDKSMPALITKIREEEPETPKKFQLAIPDLFEGVVMRMLAKRPEDRFQTPAELLKELERIGKYQGLDL